MANSNHEHSLLAGIRTLAGTVFSEDELLALGISPASPARKAEEQSPQGKSVSPCYKCPDKKPLCEWVGCPRFGDYMEFLEEAYSAKNPASRVR